MKREIYIVTIPSVHEDTEDIVFSVKREQLDSLVKSGVNATIVDQDGDWADICGGEWVTIFDDPK